MTLNQSDVVVTGHAIECRVAAEEPDNDFRPAIGRILGLKEPFGDGVRVDSGVLDGQVVSPSFDPMLAKLITYGSDREEAIQRLALALSRYKILGLPTNIAFLQKVVQCTPFIEGFLTTGFISENMDDLSLTEVAESTIDAAMIIAALSKQEFYQSAYHMPEPYASMGGWRN